GDITLGTAGSNSDVIIVGNVSGASVTVMASRQLVVSANVTATGVAGTIFLQSNGEVGGVGIRQTAGTISATTAVLDATGASNASVVQDGGNIVVSMFGVSATGSVDLSSATNNVISLTGSAQGDFRYVDADSLVIISVAIGVGRYVDIAADQMVLMGSVGNYVF